MWETPRYSWYCSEAQAQVWVWVQRLCISFIEYFNIYFLSRVCAAASLSKITKQSSDNSDWSFPFSGMKGISPLLWAENLEQEKRFLPNMPWDTLLQSVVLPVRPMWRTKFWLLTPSWRWGLDYPGSSSASRLNDNNRFICTTWGVLRYNGK